MNNNNYSEVYFHCVNFVKTYYSLDDSVAAEFLNHGPLRDPTNKEDHAKWNEIVTHPERFLIEINTTKDYYIAHLLATILHISTLGEVNSREKRELYLIYKCLRVPVMKSNSLFALVCLARITTKLRLDSEIANIYKKVAKSFNGLTGDMILSSKSLWSYGHQTTHILFLYLKRKHYSFKIKYSKPASPDNVNYTLLSDQIERFPELFTDAKPTHTLNEFFFFPALMSEVINIPSYQTYSTSFYDFSISHLLNKEHHQDNYSLDVVKKKRDIENVRKNNVFMSIRVGSFKSDHNYADHRNQDPAIILEALNELARLYRNYNFKFFCTDIVDSTIVRERNIEVLDSSTSFDDIIHIQKNSIACIIAAAGAAWAPPLYFSTPTLAYDTWPCDTGKYSHPFLTYHFRSTTLENTPSSPYRLNSSAGHTENYEEIKSKGVRINNEDSTYYVSVFHKYIQQSIIQQKTNTSTFLSHHSF